MSAKLLRACALVIACGLASEVLLDPAMGGTIRHDRADSFYTSLATDPRFVAVGEITGSEPGGGFLASGTLIQDQWVLTAAHVVDGTDGHGAGIENLQFQVGGSSHQADAMFVHPEWAASGGESNLFAGWDLALVRLDQPVSNVAPVSLFIGNNELAQVGTIVGFGATGTGQSGAQSNTAGAKRAGQNVVDIAGMQQTPGSTVSIEHDRMLAVDFDQPGNPSASTLGSPVPLDLEYITAPGDSGGGLFLEVNGQQQLAGVTSLGSTLDGSVNSDYGDRAAFTRVSQFLTWIDDTIAANSMLTLPILPGDYNGNGIVDAADYIVWRDSLGQTGTDVTADGNDDGVVDSNDLIVWRNNFGAAAETGRGPAENFSRGQIVPEPSALVWTLFAFTAAFIVSFQRRSRMPNKSKQYASREEDIQVISDAEFYLLVGKVSRHWPAPVGRQPSISRSLQLSAADIHAARRFAESPSAFILRALVEEWSWRRIKTKLDELDAASPCDRRPC